ncbi:MAG: hypothetical protein ABJA20_16520 [Novosphingobium sp.]
MAMPNVDAASMTISELREFAGFNAAEQRYIKRSLDIGLGRQDAFRVWARDAEESAAIRSQYVAYQDLKVLRGVLPSDTAPTTTGFDGLEQFIGKLVRVAAFDLAQARLESFSSFRFLYERLLGASVRPWLPAAFCAAAALPQIHPNQRKHLLQSISEAAATAQGWSARDPSFYPEWVDKEAA